mmetsp:Transcript_33909/g.73504  ORF Transcript_33909/g.73504 Transcript_33909/m.73504 type:complete len:87 (-) Transcript_33909:4-264(-)
MQCCGLRLDGEVVIDGRRYRDGGSVARERARRFFVFSSHLTVLPSLQVGNFPTPLLELMHVVNYTAQRLQYNASTGGRPPQRPSPG